MKVRIYLYIAPIKYFKGHTNMTEFSPMALSQDDLTGEMAKGM